MSELNASNLRKEHGNEGPDLVGTTELTSSYFMVPPSGTTAQRPQNPQPGTLRFNTDIGSLEFYRGESLGWESINRYSPNLGGGTGSNTGTGSRAVILGGVGSSSSNLTDRIDQITISTLGNALDFGNLTAAHYGMGVVCDGTRVITAGGRTPSFVQDIDYFTISSQGDATDSGSDLNNTENPSGLSDSVRGVFAITSGSAYKNAIDYITIQSIGTAQDFGDLTDIRGYGGALASSTRGCFVGGLDTTGPAPDLDIDVIDFVTIRSTGNATDFGNLGVAVSNMSAASNAVRGIVCGGTPNNSSVINNIQYFTIATSGNASDFGDLLGNSYANCTVASSTRFVTAQGQSNSGLGSRVNDLEFSEIASTGNTIDFGDLVDDQTDRDGISNGHGGL